MKSRAQMRQGAKLIIARIGQTYVDILGGTRGPEQLSKWLDEETYQQVCSEHILNHRARFRDKAKRLEREKFCVSNTEVFPCPKDAIEAVILVKSSTSVHAVSLRMDIVYNRWRVTHIEFI